MSAERPTDGEKPIQHPEYEKAPMGWRAFLRKVALATGLDGARPGSCPRRDRGQVAVRLAAGHDLRMSLPDDLLQRSPEEATRRIALSFLDEARAGADRLDDPGDVEALHDFRVGIRRLRSTLRAWRPWLAGSVGRKHRERLKALQGATGAGRDAEVAIEWIRGEAPFAPTHRRGVTFLSERLARRFGEAMAHAREGVRERFAEVERRLGRRLAHLRVDVDLRGAAASRELFAIALARQAEEHLDALREQLGRVTSAHEQALLHQARIATKRLRYLVEPARDVTKGAGSVVKQCKVLQDILGDLNDAHVLLAELAQAMEDAAVEQARALHEAGLAADAAALRRESRRSARSGLLELVRRCRARIDELHGQLERDWLETGLVRLVESVARLVGELHAAAGQGREIERKYLLRAAPPEAEEEEVLEIDQGWLPGQTLRERIRRVRVGHDLRFYRTVKLGAGVERIEIEEETTAPVFEALWPLTEGCRVSKRRRRVRVGDLVWEIDEFHDRDLVLAEVELVSADQDVPVPDWLEPALVREVTDDPSFTNLALAR